jgi:glycosyltransferase involved in cell wall biosynthesis
MTSVVHLLRKYDPEQWGGTETHVAALTAGLSKLDVTSEVHAPAGPCGGDTALADAVRLSRFRAFCPFVCSASTRRALYANAGNIASLHEPWRLLRDRNVDLVHLHTLGRIGGAARWAMRMTGRPYVLSVHGPLLAQQAWLERDTARRNAKAVDLGKPLGLFFGARRVLRDAARVFTFNHEEHAALAALVGDRAIYFEQGVDVARLSSGCAERARRRWPEWGDARVLLMVGRLCEQKNQLLAIRAFASAATPSDLLVLAGAATDEGYEAAIRAEAVRLSVADRVIVLGNVAPEAVPDLFARSELVLVPSRHEAFGLVLLEAWAAGRPALFHGTSGLATIGSRLHDPRPMIAEDHPRAWAEALRLYLRSSHLRSDAARDGLRLVRRHYDWATLSRRTADVYQQVLEECRARHAAPRLPITKET